MERAGQGVGNRDWCSGKPGNSDLYSLERQTPAAQSYALEFWPYFSVW